MKALAGGCFTSTVCHYRTALGCAAKAVPAVLLAADLECDPWDARTKDTPLDRARIALHIAGDMFAELYSRTAEYLGDDSGAVLRERLDHAFDHWIECRTQWAHMLADAGRSQAEDWTKAVFMVATGRAVRMQNHDDENPGVAIYPVATCAE